MSRSSTTYHFSRSTGVCAATGRMLEPGTPCVAALCEIPDSEGFDRKDYSVEAWEGGARPERLFSYWRTIVPQADSRQRLLVDDEVLMDVFNRLGEDARSQRVAFRFVLGLILLRKRLLRYVGRSGEGDGERWLMLPKGAQPEERPIEVVNPHLSDDDVRELTDQLGEVLQGEF